MEMMTNGKTHKNGKRQTIRDRLFAICMKNKRKPWPIGFLTNEFVGKRMSEHHPKAALKTIERQVVNNFWHVRQRLEEEGHGLVLPLVEGRTRKPTEKRGWYLAQRGDDGIAKEILSRKGRTLGHGNALIRGLQLAMKLKLLPPGDLASLSAGIGHLNSAPTLALLPAVAAAQ